MAAVLRLAERTDALIEGFRPDVTERPGPGPGVCLARHPRLVHRRMTGWGQDGPPAQAAERLVLVADHPALAPQVRGSRA